MNDSDVEKHLATYDGHWVVVGEYNEILNIVENDVTKKCEACSWIIEDDKLYTAQKEYLLRQDLLRFVSHQELERYLDKLTNEKFQQKSYE